MRLVLVLIVALLVAPVRPGAATSSAARPGFPAPDPAQSSAAAAEQQGSLTGPSAPGFGLSLLAQLGGTTRALAVAGNRAYVGVGPRLLVLDTTDPAAPVLVGQSPVLFGTISDIAVAGRYAYVALSSARQNGLQILDLAEPQSPRLAGQFRTTDHALGVAIAGDYALLTGEGGLYVLDVSAPARPLQVHSNQDWAAKKIVVAGRYAYLQRLSFIVNSDQLVVLDLADPQAPVPLSTTHLGDALDMALHGGIVYAATMQGLQVLSVADPARPLKLGSEATPGTAVAVVGSHVYLSAFDRQLVAIDVSDPARPQRVGASLPSARGASELVFQGQLLYLLDSQGSLVALDLGEPARPLEQGRFAAPGCRDGDHMVVLGQYAYLADYNWGLCIVDISDPAAPLVVGSYQAPTPGLPGPVIVGLAIAGSYAYLADWSSGMYIVDISDPAQPRQVGFFDAPGFPGAVAVAGSYAYLVESTYSLDSASQLHIIDVSNPALPSRVGGHPVTKGMDVVVNGEVVYVADEQAGVLVFDVRVKTLPRQVAKLPDKGVRDIALAGTLLLVPSSMGGLGLYDVSDPAAPVQLARLTPATGYSHFYRVSVAGDRAYVGRESGGLSIVDIADPRAPRLEGSYQLVGTSMVTPALSGAAVLLVENMGGGLYLLQPVALNNHVYLPLMAR